MTGLDPGWRERTDAASAPAPVDPLRWCVLTTVALLGWLLGPLALLLFAAGGLTAYGRARRAGLLRSKCLLRDTRLVLAWLGVLVVVAAFMLGRDVTRLLGG